MVGNGGQHLIVLTTEKTMAICNFHKVDRLISRHQGTLMLYPLSRFDSIQDGVELFEELLQMRPIHSVLCLSMVSGCSLTSKFKLLWIRAIGIGSELDLTNCRLDLGSKQKSFSKSNIYIHKRMRDEDVVLLLF